MNEDDPVDIPLAHLRGGGQHEVQGNEKSQGAGSQEGQGQAVQAGGGGALEGLHTDSFLLSDKRHENGCAGKEYAFETGPDVGHDAHPSSTQGKIRLHTVT